MALLPEMQSPLIRTRHLVWFSLVREAVAGHCCTCVQRVRGRAGLCALLRALPRGCVLGPQWCGPWEEAVEGGLVLLSSVADRRPRRLVAQWT